MRFIISENNKGIVKLTYHHDQGNQIDVNLGDLFADLMNCDFGRFLDILKVENKKLNNNTKTDTLRTVFLELCKENLPYPISAFFYFFMVNLISPLTDKLNMIIQTLEVHLGLISFSKRIYGSISSSKGENFEMSEWITKVEYMNGSFYEYIDISFINELLEFCLYHVFKYKIKINICENCGKYFVPYIKSNEKYCNNLFRGNKTCKQVGYENSDLIKVYRTAYKTRNAFKNRNIKNKPRVAEDFREWADEAKKMLEEAKNDKITFKEFKEWLSYKEDGI